MIYREYNIFKCQLVGKTQYARMNSYNIGMRIMDSNLCHKYCENGR